MNLKTDVFENFLLLIPLDASGPIDKSLLKTGSLLRRQLKALGNMTRRQNYRILRVINLLMVFSSDIT